MSELKHHLRKQEFPVSAREALLRLEKLCHGTSPQQQRLLQEIMEEFVFCEIDRRGIKKKRLNAIQELQLLDVLTIYFEMQDNEVVRNIVFLTLFHCEGNPLSSKMRMLTKLVSTAIATKCATVLNCSAVWMQQQGCTSDVVINLASELVHDYLLLFPKATSHLQELPNISLTFTSHFLTAVTAAYNRTGKAASSRLSLPPLSLLRCITAWVTTIPLLCSTPLVTSLQNCLPKGSIVMMAHVPIPGIIQWCVEAPLYSTEQPSKLAQSSEEQERHILYSHLHLGVMETLLETEKIRERMVQKDVILMRDVLNLCEHVLNRVQRLDFVHQQEQVQLSLDRLGQALQVALATGCLRGNMGELWSHLVKFPPNRLIQMVSRQAKGLM